MTENEAIKEIETSLELAEMCTPNREREKEIKAYKMAIQALEKQIAKKPYKGNFGVIRCSCCDEKVGQMVTSVLKEDCMNFCAYCGSKVDWQ